MTDQTFTTTSDPSDFTVDQVTAYLKDLTDQAERDRVLTAEKNGKARTGILSGYSEAPAETPAEGDGTTPGLDTSKAQTVTEAGANQAELVGEAYEKGYHGHVPSRDGDNPVDLTLAGVTGQNKDA